ncbi:hypothetical protein JZ751_027353, partial [Albula glossodonta]
ALVFRNGESGLRPPGSGAGRVSKGRPRPQGGRHDKEELFQNVLSQVAEQFSRAFKINELKTEVTNRLAMLEKRVECKLPPPPQ